MTPPHNPQVGCIGNTDSGFARFTTADAGQFRREALGLAFWVLFENHHCSTP